MITRDHGMGQGPSPGWVFLLVVLFSAWAFLSGCVAATVLAGVYGAVTSTVSLAQRNEQLNQADAQLEETRRIRLALERGGLSPPHGLSTSEAARERELRDREPRQKTFWTRLWELL